MNRLFTFLIVVYAFNTFANAEKEWTASGKLYFSAYDGERYLVTQDSLVVVDQSLVKQQFYNSFMQAASGTTVRVNSSAIKSKWNFSPQDNYIEPSTLQDFVSSADDSVTLSTMKNFSWSESLNIFYVGDQVFQIDLERLSPQLSKTFTEINLGSRFQLTLPKEAFKTLQVFESENYNPPSKRTEIVLVYNDRLFMVGTLIWTGDEKIWGIQCDEFLVFTNSTTEGKIPTIPGTQLSIAIPRDEIVMIIQDNTILDKDDFFDWPQQRHISSTKATRP